MGETVKVWFPTLRTCNDNEVVSADTQDQARVRASIYALNFRNYYVILARR